MLVGKRFDRTQFSNGAVLRLFEDGKFFRPSLGRFPWSDIIIYFIASHNQIANDIIYIWGPVVAQQHYSYQLLILNNEVLSWWSFDVPPNR